jgi:hypothetical protein
MNTESQNNNKKYGKSFFCEHQKNAPNSCGICDEELERVVKLNNDEYLKYFQNGQTGIPNFDGEAIVDGVQIDYQVSLREEDYPCKNHSPCLFFPIFGDDQIWRYREFYGGFKSKQT